MQNCSLDGFAITLIPSFYRPGKVLQSCQEILKSQRQWPTDSLKYWTRYCDLSLCLLGISNENIDLLSEMMEAILTCVEDDSLCASHSITFTMHENFIQVSCWLFLYVLASIVH